MNKFSLVVFLLCLFGLVVSQDQYTNKYDNVDVDQILNNDRLLKNYVDCVLDKGKCTPDGKELKEHIIEGLENECAKCNDKQKEGVKKVFQFLIKNKKEIFDEVAAKYDPEGKYKAKYESWAKEQGITL